jgi:2-keto-3-deoxy-L-rhamnonate aldolase RhmA
VIIGPFDLSASLGKAGQVTDPEVQDHIKRIRWACEKAGLPVGIFGATLESAETLKADGYRLLAAATDTLLLGRAGAELVSRLRK